MNPPSLPPLLPNPLPHDQWLNSVNNLLFAAGIREMVPTTDAECYFDWSCHMTPQQGADRILEDKRWREFREKWGTAPAYRPTTVSHTGDPKQESQLNQSTLGRAEQLFAAIHDLLDTIDGQPARFAKSKIKPQLDHLRQLTPKSELATDGQLQNS